MERCALHREEAEPAAMCSGICRTRVGSATANEKALYFFKPSHEWFVYSCRATNIPYYRTLVTFDHAARGGGVGLDIYQRYEH